MTIRDISVAFGFDVDRASQQQAENSIKGIKNMATKLLGKIAVVFSVAKLTSFAKDCVEAASNVEEMENKFNVVFGDMADEVDKWAEQFADSVGRNKNTIKTYLADQQNLLVGFGMTREEGSKLSEQMTSLALDIASFSNQDEDVAVNAMTKAVMGESEAAKTLGAVLNDTTRAETMAALGMSGTYDSLSQLEKMQVNYNAILRQSPDAVGDCVRSMGSYESSTRQLKAAQEEFKEFIGGQLLPVMSVFVQWVTKGVKAATKFAKAILLDADGNNRILRSFDRIHAVVKRLQPAMERFTSSMKNGINKATDTIKNIINRFGGMENALKLLAIIAGAFIIAMNWSKIVGGAKAFLSLIQGIGKLFSFANLKILGIVAIIAILALIVEDFINFLMGNDSLIGTIFDKAGIGADNARQAIFNAFNKVKEFLLNVWDLLKTAAGMWIETVKGFFERHGEQIRKNFERVWGIISTLLNGVWTFITQLAATLFGGTEDEINGSQESTKDKILAIWQAILDTLSSIWDALFAVANAIFNAVATVIETVFKWIQAFWNSWGSEILAWFKGLWYNLGQFLNGFLTVLEGVANFISSVFTGNWSGAWEAIKQVFSGIWDMITAILQQAWNTISTVLTIGLGVLQSLWNTIWTAICNFFQGIWNGIVSFISGIWSTITGVISGAINGIYSVVSSVLSAISSFFSSIFSGIASFVSSTFSNMVSGVTGFVGNIKNAIVNGLTAAIDWIKGLPSQALKWGSDIIDGIVNRYLYILYLLCSSSYGCPMDAFLLSFWSSPNYSVKIKIFLLTWFKVVLSYARKKAKEVHGMSIIPKELTDEQLVEYFREYVDGCQCKERHTEAACNEVEQYDKMVAYFFPKELKPQNRLYDKMMDVAVEYEESGFMAGYRMCLKHLQERERQTQTNTTNSIPEEPKKQEQADTGSVDALDFISSRQIGEMFSAPNGKVVRRIKNQILPYCTDDERREFSLSSERSRQNKYIEVYRLSKKACGIYLDHMEKWSGMINVMTGISEMRKKMQEVFA